MLAELRNKFELVYEQDALRMADSVRGGLLGAGLAEHGSCCMPLRSAASAIHNRRRNGAHDGV